MDGQAVSMMNFSSLIQAQISTTSLADQIISDQKEDR
jgi:predicted nuclease with TOPRIM domain